MTKFTHYLVTRFNVRIEGPGPELISSNARLPDWQESRISLFRQFCVPSVAAQDNLNFEWLIYCDAHSEPSLKHEIESSIPSNIHFEIRLVENFSAMISDLRTKCASSAAEWIITTRLDNDDAIARHFISTIQNQFVTRNKTVLNTLSGINYHLDRCILTHHRYSPRNAFCSFIESNDREEKCTTVLGFNHLHPPPDAQYIDIPVKFCFWMNLHSHNAAMRNNTGLPVGRRKALSGFTLQHPVPVSLHHTMTYMARWFPKALKRKVVFKLKKIFATGKL